MLTIDLADLDVVDDVDLNDLLLESDELWERFVEFMDGMQEAEFENLHPRYPAGTPGGLGGKFKPGFGPSNFLSAPKKPITSLQPGDHFVGKKGTLYKLKSHGSDAALHSNAINLDTGKLYPVKKTSGVAHVPHDALVHPEHGEFAADNPMTTAVDAAVAALKPDKAFEDAQTSGSKLTKAKVLGMVTNPDQTFTVTDKSGTVHTGVKIASSATPPSSGGGWAAVGAMQGVKTPAKAGHVWMNKDGKGWTHQPVSAMTDVKPESAPQSSESPAVNPPTDKLPVGTKVHTEKWGTLTVNDFNDEKLGLTTEQGGQMWMPHKHVAEDIASGAMKVQTAPQSSEPPAGPPPAPAAPKSADIQASQAEMNKMVKSVGATGLKNLGPNGQPRNVGAMSDLKLLVTVQHPDAEPELKKRAEAELAKRGYGPTGKGLKGSAPAETPGEKPAPEPAAPAAPSGDAVTDGGFQPFGSAYGPGGKYKHPKISEMEQGHVFIDKGGKPWKVQTAGDSPVISDGASSFTVDGSLRAKSAEHSKKPVNFPEGGGGAPAGDTPDKSKMSTAEQVKALAPGGSFDAGDGYKITHKKAGTHTVYAVTDKNGQPVGIPGGFVGVQKALEAVSQDKAKGDNANGGQSVGDLKVGDSFVVPEGYASAGKKLTVVDATKTEHPVSGNLPAYSTITTKDEDGNTLQTATNLVPSSVAATTVNPSDLKASGEKLPAASIDLGHGATFGDELWVKKAQEPDGSQVWTKPNGEDVTLPASVTQNANEPLEVYKPAGSAPVATGPGGAAPAAEEWHTTGAMPEGAQITNKAGITFTSKGIHSTPNGDLVTLVNSQGGESTYEPNVIVKGIKDGILTPETPVTQDASWKQKGEVPPKGQKFGSGSTNVVFESLGIVNGEFQAKIVADPGKEHTSTVGDVMSWPPEQAAGYAKSNWQPPDGSAPAVVQPDADVTDQDQVAALPTGTKVTYNTGAEWTKTGENAWEGGGLTATDSEIYAPIGEGAAKATIKHPSATKPSGKPIKKAQITHAEGESFPTAGQLGLQPGDVVQLKKGGQKLTVTDEKHPKYPYMTKVVASSGKKKWLPDGADIHSVVKADGSAIQVSDVSGAPGAPGAPAAPKSLSIDEMKAKLSPGTPDTPNMGDLPDGTVISTPDGKLAVVKPSEGVKEYDTKTYIQAYDVATGSSFEPPATMPPQSFSTDPAVVQSAQAMLDQHNAPSAPTPSSSPSSPAVAKKNGPPPQFVGAKTESAAQQAFQSAQTSANINPTSKQSVNSYVGSSAEINAVARDTKGKTSFVTAKQIAAMDDAMQAELKEHATIVRKTNLAEWQHASPGEVIRDNGFFSASWDSHAISEGGVYGNSGAGAIELHVLMKPGDKFVYPDAFGAGLSGEHEVILPKGSQFHVLKSEKKHGTTVLYVETI